MLNKLKSFLIGGDERTKKMKKNSFSMLIVKGCSLLISLAYVPMMLKSVDRTDYGILLTLTSIVHWVSLLDIGLGNGLRNSIARELAHNNVKKAKENISSCYAALTLYVSAIVVLFFIVAPFLSWQGILNAPNNDEAELLHLSLVVFFAFCFQFVVNLQTSILYACQMPAITSYIMLAVQALNFIIVYILINFFGQTSILSIGAITSLTPPIVMLISSFILFNTKLKHIAPTFKDIRLKSVNDILSIGIKFFILQIITIVLYQANNIIIAQAVNPEAVVTYNVAYKYIGMLLVIFNIIVTPVWSASTDAYARGDFKWMKDTVKYLRKVCIIATGAGIVMVILSRPIYSIWLGKETIDIPYYISAIILAYTCFEMYYKVHVSMINGMGKVFAQMIITAIIAILYIPSALLLGRYFGLAGVLIANTLVQLFNFVWAKIQNTKILNQTAEGFWNK